MSWRESSRNSLEDGELFFVHDEQLLIYGWIQSNNEDVIMKQQGSNNEETS